MPETSSGYDLHPFDSRSLPDPWSATGPFLILRRGTGRSTPWVGTSKM